jgi:uncharacterized membrane protein YdjX (TVP38/TMEM64 family)
MNKAITKMILFVVVISAFIVLFRHSPLSQFVAKDNFLFMFEQIQNEWWGPPVFILVYAIGCVFAVPGSLLTLTGGVIFGVWFGTVFNLIGANCGASLAFFMARFLGRDFIEKLVKGKKVASFDEKMRASGFLTVLRLRLIPIVPFNGLNFGSGLSAVKYKDYALGSILGMIPGCFIYTYFADALLAGTTGVSQKAFVHLAVASSLLIGISFLPTILKKFNFTQNTKDIYES